MLRITNLFNRFGLIGALSSAVLCTSTISYAQTPHSFGTADFVSEPGNPLTAEGVTRVMRLSDGKEKKTELVELDARDSAGRVRIEKRPFMRDTRKFEKITLNTPEGGTITTTRDMLGAHILIFDCPSGKTISIQPGMQIARVTESGVASPAQPRARPYSSFFNTLAGSELPPGLTFEDLGSKEIEGILAHGFKTTYMGTEKDGEWNGKTVEVFEEWVSDDLAATLLTIKTDFRLKTESRTTLTNIKREEPDASLFEIPPGYKINPIPAEMPFEMAHPKSADQKQ